MIGLKAALILTIFLCFDRLIVRTIRRSASVTIPRFASHGVVQGLIRGFVFGIGGLILLDLLGISITPILASLGIGSLAIALALQGSLTNFFAGIYIAIDQPVRLGDFIQLETGVDGYVIDIGWRSTRLKTLANSVIIIPNTKLMDGVIRNYHLPRKELMIDVEIAVDCQSDLSRVEAATRDVAKAIAPDSPKVHFHSFGTNSIRLVATLRANEFVDGIRVRHEFIKALHERFKQEGIAFPRANTDR